jgi:hypothetical protein
MIKTSLVALATAAALVGVSVPAMADTSGDGTDNSYLRDAQIAQVELQRNGVTTTGVDDWNGVWRAFVVNQDGSQSMQFFDKTSLQPVTL